MEINNDNNSSDWLKEQKQKQKITKIPTKPNKIYPFPSDFNKPKKVSLTIVQKCLNCNAII